MIETLILAAIAAIYIAGAVYMIFLTFREIVDWFQRNRRMSVGDRNEVGFTLQKRLANGNYNTVQGVFNKSTNTVGAVRSVDSSNIDEELAEYHRSNDLVVYT